MDLHNVGRGSTLLCLKGFPPARGPFPKVGRVSHSQHLNQHLSRLSRLSRSVAFSVSFLASSLSRILPRREESLDLPLPGPFAYFVMEIWLRNGLSNSARTKGSSSWILASEKLQGHLAASCSILHSLKFDQFQLDIHQSSFIVHQPFIIINIIPSSVELSKSLIFLCHGLPTNIHKP